MPSLLTHDNLQGLKRLQPRIQAWLGRSAGAADALAVKPVEQADSSGRAACWDPADKLGLDVPFPEDQRLVIWLDKTLPQVMLPTRHAQHT